MVMDTPFLATAADVKALLLDEAAIRCEGANGNGIYKPISHQNRIA
jgi:hypothetical protein